MDFCRFSDLSYVSGVTLLLALTMVTSISAVLLQAFCFCKLPAVAGTLLLQVPCCCCIPAVVGGLFVILLLLGF
jgi:hypothetical protein